MKFKYYIFKFEIFNQNAIDIFGIKVKVELLVFWIFRLKKGKKLTGFSTDKLIILLFLNTNQANELFFQLFTFNIQGIIYLSFALKTHILVLSY